MFPPYLPRCYRTPVLLDLTDSQCGMRQRQLELSAYSAVMRAMRAQGDLTMQQRRILRDLAEALDIPLERHLAEVSSALFDETLTTIAQNLNEGEDIYEGWMVESRRQLTGGGERPGLRQEQEQEEALDELRFIDPTVMQRIGDEQSRRNAAAAGVDLEASAPSTSHKSGAKASATVQSVPGPSGLQSAETADDFQYIAGPSGLQGSATPSGVEYIAGPSGLQPAVAHQSIPVPRGVQYIPGQDGVQVTSNAYRLVTGPNGVQSIPVPPGVQYVPGPSGLVRAGVKKTVLNVAGGPGGVAAYRPMSTQTTMAPPFVVKPMTMTRPGTPTSSGTVAKPPIKVRIVQSPFGTNTNAARFPAIRMSREEYQSMLTSTVARTRTTPSEVVVVRPRMSTPSPTTTTLVHKTAVATTASVFVSPTSPSRTFLKPTSRGKLMPKVMSYATVSGASMGVTSSTFSTLVSSPTTMPISLGQTASFMVPSTSSPIKVPGTLLSPTSRGTLVAKQSSSPPSGEHSSEQHLQMLSASALMPPPAVPSSPSSSAGGRLVAKELISSAAEELMMANQGDGLGESSSLATLSILASNSPKIPVVSTQSSSSSSTTSTVSSLLGVPHTSPPSSSGGDVPGKMVTSVIGGTNIAIMSSPPGAKSSPVVFKMPAGKGSPTGKVSSPQSLTKPSASTTFKAKVSAPVSTNITSQQMASMTTESTATFGPTSKGTGETSKAIVPSTQTTTASTSSPAKPPMTITSPKTTTGQAAKPIPSAKITPGTTFKPITPPQRSTTRQTIRPIVTITQVARIPFPKPSLLKAQRQPIRPLYTPTKMIPVPKAITRISTPAGSMKQSTSTALETAKPMAAAAVKAQQPTQETAMAVDEPPLGAATIDAAPSTGVTSAAPMDTTTTTTTTTTASAPMDTSSTSDAATASVSSAEPNTTSSESISEPSQGASSTLKPMVLMPSTSNPTELLPSTSIKPSSSPKHFTYTRFKPTPKPPPGPK